MLGRYTCLYASLQVGNHYVTGSKHAKVTAYALINVIIVSMSNFLS